MDAAASLCCPSTTDGRPSSDDAFRTIEPRKLLRITSADSVSEIRHQLRDLLLAPRK
jgi:hypothetical protein